MAQLIKFMKRSIKGVRCHTQALTNLHAHYWLCLPLPMSPQFIANLSDLGLSTFLKPVGRGLLPLVTQAYEGDCTIVPKWTWEDLAGLLRNPTRERFDQAILVGQRATWEKLSWVRPKRAHVCVPSPLKADWPHNTITDPQSLPHRVHAG